ncbi:MAG: quinate 5-dehydrogenase, partial [Deinococcales bacterium]
MSIQRVVSVSLGSSSRNSSAELEVLGQKFLLERIGTDGSMKKAAQMLADLDGKVAAIGLGGTDLHIVAGAKRYSFRDILKLAANVKSTP